MATEIRFNDGPTIYKNKVEVSIHTEGNIEASDAKVIYDALHTIAEAVKKYYHPDEYVEEGEE